MQYNITQLGAICGMQNMYEWLEHEAIVLTQIVNFASNVRVCVCARARACVRAFRVCVCVCVCEGERAMFS